MNRISTTLRWPTLVLATPVRLFIRKDGNNTWTTVGLERRPDGV